jgi:phage major head subunit gpT-like protein
MVRGQFDIALFEQNLKEVFGLGYADVPSMYEQLFNVSGSSMAAEEDLGMIGLPAMARKKELGTFSKAEFKSGLKTRYEHLRYGLSLSISYETLRDMRYGQVDRAIRQFGRSAKVTRETLGAAVLNNAFTAIWHATPNKPLLATDHPLETGGTWANRLAVDSDPSIASIQDMLTLVRQTPDQRGILIAMKGVDIWVPNELDFLVRELLTSTDRPDTADRATNVLNGLLNIKVWDYLTDADAWFITTRKADHMLKWYDRDPLETGLEEIAQTGGDKFYWAAFRSSCGASDPRGVYGTPGAA